MKFAIDTMKLLKGFRQCIFLTLVQSFYSNSFRILYILPSMALVNEAEQYIILHCYSVNFETRERIYGGVAEVLLTAKRPVKCVCSDSRASRESVSRRKRAGGWECTKA